LIRPHLGLFSLALIALLVASSVNLVFPQIARFVVQEDVFSWMVANPGRVAFMVIGLFALQGVAFYLRALWFGTIGHRVVSELRHRLFASLIARDVTFFDQQRTGDLVSRLISDCVQIQEVVSLKLSVLIRYTVQVVVGIILMAVITPRLTLALLVGLPILVGLSLVLSRSLKQVSRALQRQLGVCLTLAEEVFAGQRVVKAFCAEARKLSHFEAENSEVLRLGVSRARIAAFFSSFINFLMNSFLVLVVLYGVTMVASSELSLGDLTAFLLYAAIVGVSFAFLAGTYAEFAQAMGGVSRVFELLPVEQTATPSSAAASNQGALNGSPSVTPVHVEFGQVNFSYPERPEARVLDDLTFELPPGTITAVVGPSGAGKTSITALLLGFYQPTQGVIRLNGVVLGSDDAARARSVMSYVPQEPTLFGVSLKENLLLGNPNSSHEEMQGVLRELGLESLLQSLPQGLDTMLGDRALQLSGGQRQRIALARALLKPAGLLILDEATSAVDSETESLVQSAVARRRQGKTILIIAHRLSTVRNADQILVLEEGSIVQQGTHDSLLQNTGLYRSMVERQELSPAA
jgi:ATP-binding cassette subfamily B protein